MNKKYFTFLVVLFLFIYLTGCGGKYKFDQNESLAYAKLNLAAASSAYDGSGNVSNEDLDCLKQMVKKFDGNNEWFSEFSTFYARTADTDVRKVTYLCDDNYCAKFTVEETGDNYYLIDYSFEMSNDKGYKIHVVDDND